MEIIEQLEIGINYQEEKAMNFNQFPYTFKEELDRITNQKINQLTQQKNDAVH